MSCTLGGMKITRYRIRKNGEGVYMQPDGSWGPYRTASKFKCQDRAIRFAEKNGAERFGLFPQKAVGD
jgi:hypothetical protein